MERSDLINAAMDLYDEAGIKLMELRRTDKEMMRLYQETKESLAAAIAENKELHKQLVHVTNIHTLQARELFGRSTEKTSDLVSAISRNTIVMDPIDEDADPAAEEPVEQNRTDPSALGKSSRKGHSGTKLKGKKKLDLSLLPSTDVYEYDIHELDGRFGEGNWFFAFWRCHPVVEVIKRTTYVKNVYTPVVSFGSFNSLYTVPYDGAVFQKSIVSSSLLATIMTDKYGMYLPTYRQENDTDRFGFPLSRTTMSNWMIKAAKELISPVYRHACGLLKGVTYQQCDETPYLVINDGRSAGRKSYIWAHRNSELLEGPTIIAYCIEETRAADHLCNFFEGITDKIYLACDAYGAYPAFADNASAEVVITGCLMHARRRFVDALALVNTDGMDPGIIYDLPEMKAVILINRVYEADEPLKHRPAEERLALRQKIVRPLWEEFTGFIHEFDLTDPSLSEKMKDAVSYSLNHEATLGMFLNDPYIPIDNGACERSIKPVALLRRNSLFSYSFDGASSAVMIITMIELAKANGAIPYYYLKFLLDTMPKHVYRGIPYGNMDDMMPWSDAYKAYEIAQRNLFITMNAPPGSPRPESPSRFTARKRSDPVPA